MAKRRLARLRLATRDTDRASDKSVARARRGTSLQGRASGVQRRLCRLLDDVGEDHQSRGTFVVFFNIRSFGGSMSAERLAALKASAARTRLRVQVMSGRPPINHQPLTRDPRAFTSLMSKDTQRPGQGYKSPGS